MRIASSALAHQEFAETRCGCGKERPVAEPWFAVPKGWEYRMVLGGRLSSAYQWRCPECVAFEKGIVHGA